MKRRGFLKGLGAIAASAAVIIPAELKAVAKEKKLTDLEKAKKIDTDFTSPFLYVEATEDIKQGDPVAFNGKDYKIKKLKFANNSAIGIATVNIPMGSWGFIQTVAHCKLPPNKDNYFKSF